MIVPAMNPEEIYKEITKDEKCLQRKILEASITFQLEMSRKKIAVAAHTFLYKTSQLNEWRIKFQWKYNQLKDISYYLKTTDKIGHVAYLINKRNDGNDFFVVKFNSHFFKRYNQRLNLELKEPSEVIKHFFKNNDKFKSVATEILEDGTRYITYLFNGGIGVGWEQDSTKTINFKTFIANNTLTEKQQILSKYIEEGDDSKELDILVIISFIINILIKQHLILLFYPFSRSHLLLIIFHIF